MEEDQERQGKLGQLAHLKQLGEKAYDDMYEAHNFRDADDFYREAKDCYYDAIGLARELGLNEEAEALHERLWHIKQVYWHQFSH
jgi:hypothetical protein